MDYEKKYKEAQKWIESIYSELSHEQQMEAEAFFPELKESEDVDKKIREEIIATIHLYYGKTLEDEAKEMIAWLEKQEGCEYIKKDWLEHIKQSWYKEGFIDGKYSGGTSKEWTINDVAIFKEIIDFLENGTAKLQHDLTLYANWLKTQFPTNEKQGEQKPADKVEPKYEAKFHEGNWVFIEEVKGYKNGPFQIKTVDSFGYSFDEYHTIPFMYEELLSKWTIQDARPGDVLYHKAESGVEYIVMNKGLNEHNNIDSYFRYSSINGFNTDIPSVLSAKCDSITPATKEQRDFLFQKMKEDGYEWDAEKKELKKIEDEEYNGEDYGIDSLYHAQRILEKTLGKVDGYQTDDGILEHKCAIAAVNKLYKQKPAEWSEEDENRINRLIAYFEDKESFTAEDDIVYANWLKSLKPQNTWKPSDEQIVVLELASKYERVFTPKQIDILIDLKEQLKKLTK